MLERYVVAQSIARILNLRLSKQEDVDFIKSSGLPAVLKNDNVLSALEQVAPGQTILDALKFITGSSSEPVSLAHPIVRLLSGALPEQANLIEGAVSAYLDDPSALMAQTENLVMAKATKAISSVVSPPTLTRCRVCNLPFETDGSRGCPHCEN